MMNNQWSYKPLSELCDINIGKTPSRSKSEYWGKGYPWVSISDLKEKYISTTKEEITEEALKASNHKIVRKGTLLMSFKLSIGKLAFVERDLYTNEAIAALLIKDNKSLFDEYLYYVLKYIPLTGSNRAAMGKTLNKQSLSVLQILLPPTLDDQKRIAKILLQCEALIQKRRESIELLDELLKSTFLEMFGDPFINPYNLPMVTLEDIVKDKKNAIVDGPFGSSIKQSDYRETGIPIIRINNIRFDGYYDCDYKFISEEKYEELKRSKVEFNDILITRVGNTIGKTCIFDKAFKALLSTTGVAKATIDNAKASVKFILTQMQLPQYVKHIWSQTVGGGQPYLNLKKIKAFPLLLPKTDAQKDFVEIVEKIDFIKKSYKESLQKLENLYGSINQRAFKSELDLSKIDISDMEDSKIDIEDIKDILLEKKMKSIKQQANLAEIISNKKEDEFYLSKNCQQYIEKSKALKTIVFELSKKGSLNINDIKESLIELNNIGENLQAEVKEYTPSQVDQNRSVERYISLLPENILNQYPHINLFSKNKFDYSSMSLDEYYGIPNEIITEYGGSIENAIIDLEFFFKKHFSNKSFTIKDVELSYNRVTYERGDWFKYDEMKEAIFKFMEGEDALLTQVFEVNPEPNKERFTKQIMLKVAL